MPGEPAREIVDFAAANQVDLVMMPTHGYGPFRQLLLGSVAAKVLHDAHVPGVDHGPFRARRRIASIWRCARFCARWMRAPPASN